MAPRERVELSSAVLETVVLPLNYRDIGGSYGNRTRVFGSTVRYNSHYTNEPGWQPLQDLNLHLRNQNPASCQLDERAMWYALEDLNHGLPAYETGALAN